jgi:hypothetical protein
MSSFLVLLAGIALAGEPSANAVSDVSHPRLYREINHDLREALRAEALATSPGERSEAVHRMAEIYREILADPRLPHSEALKGYRTRLWSRMTRVKQALEREARRQSSSMDSEQQAAIEQAAQDLAEQMSLMNYTLGGPAYVFQKGGGAFGGRAVNDHGQELIQLIERTIRPDFWDTAGGPGRMFYYQPLMALVVTATSEVHGNVGGLLGDLRRAGQ